MNNTVWKYELERACRNQPLWMPKGAVILTAQMQTSRADESLVLWALVDALPEMEREERVFDVVGTGSQLPEGKNHVYVDTAQSQNGLVWHVFERL